MKKHVSRLKKEVHVGFSGGHAICGLAEAFAREPCGCARVLKGEEGGSGRCGAPIERETEIRVLTLVGLTDLPGSRPAGTHC